MHEQRSKLQLSWSAFMRRMRQHALLAASIILAPHASGAAPLSPGGLGSVRGFES